MPKPLDEEQDRLAVNIALVILTVTLTSLVWYFGGIYESGVTNTLIDASVSIILTGIVAAIYYRQWRTEKKQVEIGEAMKDFQSQPALDVVDKKPIKSGWKLYLGNFGFGPAHDLHLIIDIDVETDDYAPQSTPVRLENQLDDSGNDDLSTNAILPKSESEPFLAEDVDVYLEDSEPISLSTLFEELDIYADDGSEVTINLTVKGQDGFKDEYTADAGEYTIVVDDLSGVADYNVDTILTRERN
ncbi:hypothetical protein [Haloplanus sp. C73]|uniref:hypothetical protein n=1 Tax=Haloplanus sp. C73 TaxID=3421641 RepID=UPI003EC0999C